MNQELLNAIKKRKQQLGGQDDGGQDKPKQQNDVKKGEPVAKGGQNFNKNKQMLENLFGKKNQPEPVQKAPKQEIKGDQKNFNNAKALLQQQFGKQNTNSLNVNSGSSPNTLPPPPSIGMPSLPLNLPPPPPPPPIGSLPPIGNLPPPPTLNIGNLPPPPSLNLANLPPPPPMNIALNNPQMNQNNPPPKMPNLPPPIIPSPVVNPPPPTINPVINLPPPPSINLPPPPSNIPQNINQNPPRNVQNVPISQNNTPHLPPQNYNNLPPPPPPPNNILPPPPINFNQNQNIRQQIKPQVRQSQTHNQPSNYNQPNQQPSYNQPNQQPSYNQPNQQPSYNQSNHQYNQPSYQQNPSNQVKPQQNNIQNYVNIKPQSNIPQSKVNEQDDACFILSQGESKPKVNSNIPQITAWDKDELQKKQKRRIFDNKSAKRYPLTQQFFGKNIGGLIKQQFLKSVQILKTIDLQVKITKFNFNFPTIQNKIRSIEPVQTLYANTDNLDLVSCYMTKNLNAIKVHSEQRDKFINSIKGYNWQTDPLKYKQIRQSASNLPNSSFIQPNYVQLKNAFKKVDRLINNLARQHQFQKCNDLKKIKDQTQKMLSSYIADPKNNASLYERIDNNILKMKNIEE